MFNTSNTPINHLDSGPATTSTDQPHDSRFSETASHEQKIHGEPLSDVYLASSVEGTQSLITMERSPADTPAAFDPLTTEAPNTPALSYNAGYKTPRAPSFSPITLPRRLSHLNEGYKTPRAPSFSPITPPRHSAEFEENVAEADIPPLELTPMAIDTGENAADVAAAIPAPLAPSQGLDGMTEQPLPSRLLKFPSKVLQHIVNLILIDVKPVSPKRKSPHRRQIEAGKMHIITVGRDKIIRERQNRAMKSNVARTINTASPTNLFLVCRKFRDVGIPTYYSNNTFSFSSNYDLSAWARSIGSRRELVKKMELRSEWETFFKDQTDLSPGSLSMKGTGVLQTAALRRITEVEEVHLAISCVMPWQRSTFAGRGTIDLELKEMCWQYTSQVVQTMVEAFKATELYTSTINTQHSLVFDEAWVEPYYESARFKRVAEEEEHKLQERRAKRQALSEEQA